MQKATQRDVSKRKQLWQAVPNRARFFYKFLSCLKGRYFFISMLFVLSFVLSTACSNTFPGPDPEPQPGITLLFASDYSASSRNHADFQKWTLQHCRAFTDKLAIGDSNEHIAFADTVEVLSKNNVERGVDKLKSCPEAFKRGETTQIGKQDGTSLVAVLKHINSVLEHEERVTVAAINIMHNEAGPANPYEDVATIKHNLQNLLTKGNVIVTIVVGDPELYNHLYSELNHENLSICHPSEVNNCATDAFKQARRQQ